jgi:hypothetical protein
MRKNRENKKWGGGRNVEEKAVEDVRENKGYWRRGKMRESWEGESGGGEKYVVIFNYIKYSNQLYEHCSYPPPQRKSVYAPENTRKSSSSSSSIIYSRKSSPYNFTYNDTFI